MALFISNCLQVVTYMNKVPSLGWFSMPSCKNVFTHLPYLGCDSPHISVEWIPFCSETTVVLTIKKHKTYLHLLLYPFSRDGVCSWCHTLLPTRPTKLTQPMPWRIVPWRNESQGTRSHGIGLICLEYYRFHQHHNGLTRLKWAFSTELKWNFVP